MIPARVVASSLSGLLLACGGAQAKGLLLLSDPSLGSYVEIAGLAPVVLDIEQDGVATLPMASWSGNYLLQGPITIGQNGGIGFGKGCQYLDPENQPIPSDLAFSGAQAVLVYWDDIDDKDGDIEYATMQDGPSSTRVIVQWTVPNFDDAGSILMFQVQIFSNYQPTGVYAQCAYRIKGPTQVAGVGATIGYQDGPAGFDDIQYSFDGNGAVADGTVLTVLLPAPSDLDQDGDTTVEDILVLLSAWGPCGDCQMCPADLDGDCVVGAEDLAILLSNWLG